MKPPSIPERNTRLSGLEKPFFLKDCFKTFYKFPPTVNLSVESINVECFLVRKLLISPFYYHFPELTIVELLWGLNSHYKLNVLQNKFDTNRVTVDNLCWLNLCALKMNILTFGLYWVQIPTTVTGALFSTISATNIFERIFAPNSTQFD